MTTIGINQKFNLVFTSHLRDYERDLILLRKLGFNPSYEDVTQGNSISYAEGRPEVLFTIPSINVQQASFIKEAMKRSS